MQGRTIKYLGPLTAFMLVISLAVLPAGAADAPLVSLEPLLSYDTFAPGKSYPLALKITVGRGFHINTTRPPDPNLVPTRLTLAPGSGLSFSLLEWPQPEHLKVAFMDGTLPVHGGTFLVRTNMDVSAQAKPGMRQVKGGMFYQGCNSRLCLMPEEVEFAFQVQIGKAGVESRPLNQEIFGKLK